MSNHNHSQLEELRTSEKDLWKKRVGMGEDSEVGYQTPLGHAYSIILEELAENELDSTPRPKEFLEFIRKNSPLSLKDNVNLMSPSYFDYFTDPMIRYMKEKGLNPSSCEKIMKDIVGPDFPYYSLKNIERDFFRSSENQQNSAR